MAPIAPTRLLSHRGWKMSSRGQTHSGMSLMHRVFHETTLLAVRCFGTYANYLGHLRGACHALGLEAPPVGHPAIRRAMVAITKRELFKHRAKRFINKYVRVQTFVDYAHHLYCSCLPGLL